MTSRKLNFWRRMAAEPPLCCHSALASNLSSRQLCPGVRARDKLLLDLIEEKQEKIFEEKFVKISKKEDLAVTDKGKKELKTVLGLLRKEVENCDLTGLVGLQIVTKSGGVFGGGFLIDGTDFNFIVDNKKKKGKKMAITVERIDARPKENSILDKLVNAINNQGARRFGFTIPLRCTSCQPRLKEARYQEHKSNSSMSKPKTYFVHFEFIRTNSGSSPSLGS